MQIPPFELRTEIHFYDQYDAAAFIEGNLTLEDAELAECLHLAAHAARQFMFVGPNSDPARACATFIAQGPLTFDDIVDGESVMDIKIRAYPGHAGKKYFTGHSKWDGRSLVFKNDAKGFGFFGRGLDFYAPSSILVMMNRMVRRRGVTSKFGGLVQVTASYVAKDFLEGSLSLSNMNETAVAAVDFAEKLVNRRI